VLCGYADDKDAMAAIFVHLRAVFQANGMDLQLHTLGGDG
jgi:hypothetical protein